MVRVILRGGVIRLSDFAGSGILILASGLIEPRRLSWIAIPLALVWVVTSFRFRRDYPTILVKFLSERQFDPEPMDDEKLQMVAGRRESSERLRLGLASGDDKLVMHSAQVLARLRPPDFTVEILCRCGRRSLPGWRPAARYGPV